MKGIEIDIKKELKDLEFIKTIYYDTLKKLDDVEDVELDDYIERLLYFDRDSMVNVTKIINKQANFVMECKEKLPESLRVLEDVETGLRIVVNYLKQKLITFHGLRSVSYTKNLELKFEY